MVHAGGRGLDPLQPALPDHAVPIDRHLGMAAEDVGPEDFLGDPLLAGIDDFGLGDGGGDLPRCSGFDRIAKDDAHGGLECACWQEVCIVGRKRTVFADHGFHPLWQNGEVAHRTRAGRLVEE